jgi:hypothetical protein
MSEIIALDHQDEDSSLIKNNKTTVVCDAGDRNVDVKIYKALSEGGKKYLEELTTSHKGVGGSHIDELVRLWIRGHLGDNISGYELDDMVKDFIGEMKVIVLLNQIALLLIKQLFTFLLTI